jgi:hypothetical protein
MDVEEDVGHSCQRTPNTFLFDRLHVGYTVHGMPAAQGGHLAHSDITSIRTQPTPEQDPEPTVATCEFALARGDYVASCDVPATFAQEFSLCVLEEAIASYEADNR